MPPSRSIRTIAACAIAAALAAQPAAAEELRDLYYGEALFYAYQEDWFDALNRLDSEIAQYRGVDEPELDTLRYHIDHAEFSVGDFELHYRMHQRAGRAIAAVLEANVPAPIRNEAAFRLARLQFQKSQLEDALRSLDRIEGEIPDDIAAEVELLRANLFMATGKPQEAAEILRRIPDSSSDRGYARYNLGIALLKADEAREAVRQLDKAGQLSADSAPSLAIRDKSNLVLGTLLYEANQFDRSKHAFDRVRLSGPYSNQALLKAGWADLAGDQYERALVPWSILADRDTTDPAVQEALLALPYAYSKLQIHGRAAVLYGHAVETFGRELEKVDASISSIHQGHFLEALVREDIRHDEDWVVRLRSLPDAPETFYLLSLMSSHEFQSGLQNYLDLEDMRKRLVQWEISLDAFDDVIRVRRAYYEPRLPAVDQQFRELDARIRLRLEQQKQLQRRLEHLLVAPNPDLLATADEHLIQQRLDALDRAIEQVDPDGDSALAARLRRLGGVLDWQLQELYHERLTEAHEHLRELNAEIDILNERYESFVRTRQAATHSYEGYGDHIRQLRSRIRMDQEQIRHLMTRQGQMLETVAIEVLVRRREHLANYMNQARFAFADSYDRAAKAQAR